MKASLIWPAVTSFSSLDDTWLPHGVTQLATVANLKGHEVDVWDGRTMGLEGLKGRIKTTDSELVGFSVLSAYAGFAKELIEFTRKQRPDLKIVVGGIHPTLVDDFDDFDFLVKGEGEMAFTDILDGEATEKVIYGKPPDLKILPAIDRSLVSIAEEPMPGLDKPFATVIIGRGCPYRCSFCYPAERVLFGNRVRYRPAENVVAELEALNVKSFMVHDDCFTASMDYVATFCDLIEGKGWKWWCQGRADNVCEHMDAVRRMRDCGLTGMILGHESGDDRVLQALNKDATVSQNLESAAFLRSLGILVWSNIMVGIPDEPPSAVINTIAMVQTMRPDFTSICNFTPHPGTKLWDYCSEQGLIPEHDYTYFNRGDGQPKIVGPDYDFLKWACHQMVQGRAG